MPPSTFISGSSLLMRVDENCKEATVNKDAVEQQQLEKVDE